MTPHAEPLTQRLAAGRLPLHDALRCATQIIDALRHAHDEGCCHGALTPDAIILTASGVELVPAQAGAGELVTPYTAPERLAGQGPDAKSDIFSLGAILYEMFTGRRAFSGDTPEELQASIVSSTPEPIGDTALDRLVSNCLVKDPAGRWHRVQQVHMEFKILAFSARRAQGPATPRRPDPAVLAELRQLESRLALRLDQESEEAAAGLQALSSQLPQLESRLVSRLEQQNAETTAALRHVAAELPLLESHFVSHLEKLEGAATSGLRHLAAELPLVESRVTARLEQHEGALAGVQQAVAELPNLESRIAARLEQHGGALSGVQQAIADLPQLTSRLEQHDGALSGVQQAIADLPQLTSRLDQHDDALSGVQQAVADLPQLTSRLEQHDDALSGLQQAVAELPNLESRLTGVQQAVAEMPQLTSRLDQHDGALSGVLQAVADLPQLTSRLEQHEDALLGMLETASGLPQLTSRLDQHDGALSDLAQFTSRLEQYDGALAGVQQAVAELPQLTSRLEQYDGALATVQQAVAELPNLESRVTSQLEKQSAVVESLQHASAEQRSAVEFISQSVNSVQEEMLALEGKLAAAHECAQHAEQAAQKIEGSAKAQSSLFGEVEAIGNTVRSHAAAIDSIRASMARTDDFMERVVEALESLQTMVLEQARDRTVA